MSAHGRGSVPSICLFGSDVSRVGVLGGTFDPIHFGHLRAAEIALQLMSLDRVLFVPAANPPHKQDLGVTDAIHRVGMLEAALEKEKKFEISRAELERSGLSFTFDTLVDFHGEWPDTLLYFIMGSDAFGEIRTWKRWQELTEKYSFVVYERPGKQIDQALDILPNEIRDRVVDLGLGGKTVSYQKTEGIFVVRNSMLTISSTEIRRLVRRKKTVRFLVPKVVEQYIYQNYLYTNKDQNT